MISSFAIILAIVVILLSIFGCACSRRSKNINFTATPGATSVLFEIPQNKSGLGSEVNQIEVAVELINRITRKRDYFRLTKEFPFQNLPITPETAYAYKWRTKESNLEWSEWSKLESFVSRASTSSKMQRNECLETIKKGKNFNALILGKVGAGKSSFINSENSAIAGRYLPVARTAPAGKTTTQCLVEHELVPGKVHFYDMPGIEETFSLDLLKQILEGKVENITVDRVKAGVSAGNPNQAGELMISKIDLVIIVISASDIREKKEFHDYDKIIDLLKDLSIPYMAVLTKADKIVSETELPISRDKFHEDSRVLEQIQKIPVDMKFPMVNYSSGDVSRPEVDEILFRILQSAQDLAHSDLVKLQN